MYFVKARAPREAVSLRGLRFLQAEAIQQGNLNIFTGLPRATERAMTASRERLSFYCILLIKP